MDVRKLGVFLAIVEEGTVTGAGRRLHIAQPSVSHTLRSLEVECGVQLFHRVGRGLLMTPAGEALVGPARDALRAIEGARHALSEVKDVVVGRVDLAALSTLASDPLAGFIGAFRREHPQITFRVLEAEGVSALSAHVRDGLCELAFVDLPLTGPALVTVPLGRQELVLVFPPLSRSSDEPVPLTALVTTPLVVAPTGTSTRTLLDEALRQVGLEPLIAVETSAREATVPLVLAGAGAALLPAATAREAKRRGAIIRRPDPPITREIGAVYRNGPLSPSARSFLEHARALQQAEHT